MLLVVLILIFGFDIGFDGKTIFYCEIYNKSKEKKGVREGNHAF